MKHLESIGQLFQGLDLREADCAGEDLVNMAGGHPRTLQYVHGLLVEERRKKDSEKRRFAELLDKLMDKCRSQSNSYWIVGKQLLGAAICSVPVRPEQRILAMSDNSGLLTVDQVRENGYCTYLLEHGGAKVIPVLTPLQVVGYFDQFSSSMAAAFKATLHPSSDQSLFCGKPFEYFHSHFDAYSRMLWVDSHLKRPNTVSIRQFYSRNFDASYLDESNDIHLYDEYYLKAVSVTFLEFFVHSKGNINGRASYHNCK